MLKTSKPLQNIAIGSYQQRIHWKKVGLPIQNWLLEVAAVPLHTSLVQRRFPIINTSDLKCLT